MRPRIAILGGGISGLSLAYFLKKGLLDRAEIVLLEARNRVGGWIKSKRENDVIFEQGPRSFRAAASLETLKLVKKLKLENELVMAHKEALNRFLYFKGQLIKLPSGPKDLVFSSMGRKLLHAALRDLSLKKSHADETVYDFFRRRFSPFVADIFADALVSGVYAGDSKKLSIKSCFPKIYALEQEYGSVVKGAFLSKLTGKNHRPGLSGLFSFNGGVETLVDALKDNVHEHIRYNQGVKAITVVDRTFRLQCHDEDLTFDYVFSCLPAATLAPLVAPQKQLSLLLKSIPYSSIAVVNVAFAHDVYKAKGFGYLIPKSEKQENLGVVWDSSVFSNHCKPGHSILTVMIGGEQDENFNRYNEEDFIKIAMNSVSHQMGITAQPYLVNVARAHHAIPQYVIGHSGLIERIQKECTEFSPHFFVLGSSFFGVSVNDCIKKSQEMAQEFIKKIFTERLKGPSCNVLEEPL